MHILTKLFLRDFTARDAGYLLNVSSASAFAPGPLMAAYYASKVYVLYLTLAIWKELRHQNSHVSISALCPGPVDTEFDLKADVTFTPASKPSYQIAECALKQMFARRMLIVPGLQMKLAKCSARLLPTRAVLAVSYHLQHRRQPKHAAMPKSFPRPN